MPLNAVPAVHRMPLQHAYGAGNAELKGRSKELTLEPVVGLVREEGLAARVTSEAAILDAERVELGELLAEHSERTHTHASKCKCKPVMSVLRHPCTPAPTSHQQFALILRTRTLHCCQPDCLPLYAISLQTMDLFTITLHRHLKRASSSAVPRANDSPVSTRRDNRRGW